jgi:hypothetical protein
VPRRATPLRRSRSRRPPGDPAQLPVRMRVGGGLPAGVLLRRLARQRLHSMPRDVPDGGVRRRVGVPSGRHLPAGPVRGERRAGLSRRLALRSDGGPDEDHGHPFADARRHAPAARLCPKPVWRRERLFLRRSLALRPGAFDVQLRLRAAAVRRYRTLLERRGVRLYAEQRRAAPSRYRPARLRLPQLRRRRGPLQRRSGVRRRRLPRAHLRRARVRGGHAVRGQRLRHDGLRRRPDEQRWRVRGRLGRVVGSWCAEHGRCRKRDVAGRHGKLRVTRARSRAARRRSGRRP